MPPLLEVDDLKVHYALSRGLLKPSRVVHAVDGVSFTVEPGEIVGVVGESGCGKTTVARAVLGLTRATSGAIRLEGQDVGHRLIGDRSGAERRTVQMVFQDPFESLNPRKTVLATLSQPLRIHAIVPRNRIRDEAIRLLDLVGLSPGEAYLNRYPHQFSGGQRQRICIARAIALRPRLVVADEAVSALDVSIRAQILTLMRRLKDEFGLGYLFITHDLGVVRSFCHRVVVMYLGHVVEEGDADEIFDRPRHPYTTALLNASPIADPVAARKRRIPPVSGDVPSPLSLPPGCRFHTRCPVVRDICRTEKPPFRSYLGGRQRARCHFADEAESWPIWGRSRELTT